MVVEKNARHFEELDEENEVTILVELKKCHYCHLTFDVSEQYTFDIHERECQLLGHNFGDHNLDHFICKICGQVFAKYFKQGELSVEIFIHLRNHRRAEVAEQKAKELTNLHVAVPMEKPTPLMDLQLTPPITPPIENPKEPLSLQTCQHCNVLFTVQFPFNFRNHMYFCQKYKGYVTPTSQSTWECKLCKRLFHQYLRCGYLSEDVYHHLEDHCLRANKKWLPFQTQ